MSQLDLGKLTIFAGANSSGKSSIIQSMLLIVQTFMSSDHIGALQINGNLVSLGTVYDMWHDGDVSSELFIELIVDIPDRSTDKLYVKFVVMPRTFGDQETKVDLISASYAIDRGDDYQDFLSVGLDENNLYIMQSCSESATGKIVEEIRQSVGGKVDSLDQTPVRLMDFLIDSLTLNVNVNANNRWSTILRDPNQYSNQYKGTTLPEDVFEFLTDYREKHSLPNFGPTVFGINPFELFRQSDRLQFEEYQDWFNKLKGKQLTALQDAVGNFSTETRSQFYRPQIISEISDAVRSLFTNRLRYLSANRISPTALFALSAGEVWSEVGIDGSNVAAAINQYQYKKIRFWHPQKGDLQKDYLINAVLIWLEYFQLITDIVAIDNGKFGTLLQIKAPGVDRQLDLTAVGFGTSQVLPIIVQGLLTPRDGVFIVEQPEVHLHQKVQAQLAFFFFALSRAGVQCIVETHSDTIVNQFRKLIAEHGDSVGNDVAIYFASRDKQHGTSFERIEVGKNGQITNWPKDFMDQNKKISEEILSIVAQKGSKS